MSAKSQENRIYGAGRRAQVVEHLPSKYETLSLNQSTTKIVYTYHNINTSEDFQSSLSSYSEGW
jgi:hypothetical protein